MHAYYYVSRAHSKNLRNPRIAQRNVRILSLLRNPRIAQHIPRLRTIGEPW